MMMMMMMISGFVERVINSQTRCRSTKEMSLANIWGESCSSQMTGPATAKLLIPSVVVVLGTDRNPVRTDRIGVSYRR